MSGVKNDPSINILDRVKSLISYNLEFWMSGVNNDPSIQTLYGIEQYYSKFYNIEWDRRLPAQITTIMNEWCLQWLQDYHYGMSGVNNDPSINIIDRVKSLIC